MSVVCPHCEKRLQVSNAAEHNVESYGHPALVKALCCGKPIKLRRVISLAADIAHTQETHDDWGNEFVKEFKNMNNFKNMKIEITDYDHLKAVCDVLVSMGYFEGLSFDFDEDDEYKWVGSGSNGVFGYYTHKNHFFDYSKTTLSDLIKMRDEIIK